MIIWVCVITILNDTIIFVIISIPRKWYDISIIVFIFSRSNMINNKINHEEHSFCMKRFHQILEILFCSEMGVYFCKVFCPIAMIALVRIFYDWRNTNSIETKTLNILKITFNSFERSSTIVIPICTS